MGALSMPEGSDAAPRPAAPHEDGRPPAAGLALNLQYCRAGLLSLTRLQLALERGDRVQAMAAIDHLHALDLEMERAVEALALPAPVAWPEAIGGHLKEEKMAIAFEKLALASGISGPKLTPRSSAAPGVDAPPRDSPPAGLGEWPPPESRMARLLRRHVPRILLLAAIVAATLAAVMLAL